MKFEITAFWEKEDSYAYRDFWALDAKAQVRVVKRLKVMTQKSVINLFHANELERVRKGPPEVYELKLKITPPVRMLGTLENNRFTPVYIFVKKRQRLTNQDIDTAVRRING